MEVFIIVVVIGLIIIFIKVCTGGYDREVTKSQMPKKSDIDKAEQEMARQLGVTKFIKKPNGTVKFMMTESQLNAFKIGEGKNYYFTVDYSGGYYIVDNLSPKH